MEGVRRMRRQTAPKTGLETLERYVRTVRIVSPLFLGIFLLVSAILFFALGGQMPRNDLFLLLGILAGTGILVALLLHFFLARVLAGVHRSIRLLKSEQPHRMLVRFTGVLSMKGPVVTLQDTDAQERPHGLLLAMVRTSSKKQGSAKEAVPVDVYFSPSGDRELVFEVPQDYAPDTKQRFGGLSAGNVFWGKLCDRRQLESSWKQMLLLMLGMGLLSACIVAALAWVAQQSLDNARQNLAWAQQSPSWPAVPGVILESALAEVSIKSGKSRVPGFLARIRYEYVVGKRTFTGKRIFFGYEAQRTPRLAEQLVSRYPRGAGVEIRYNPQNPALSVLEPGHTRWNEREAVEAERGLWIALSISSLLFIIPLVLFALMSRRYKALREELRRSMGMGGMGGVGGAGTR